MEDMKPIAEAQGFAPDFYATADLVPEARPCPHMVWLNAIQMNVHPIEAIIKVGDQALHYKCDAAYLKDVSFLRYRWKHSEKNKENSKNGWSFFNCKIWIP